MHNLFAFTQAQEMRASAMPSGRYDAEQQLWIADEISYATERMPVEGGTCIVTSHVTGMAEGFDHGADCKYDW